MTKPSEVRYVSLNYRVYFAAAKSSENQLKGSEYVLTLYQIFSI